MRIKIAPAIMDADLARLGEAVAQLEEAGADLLHVDIMDGHFVPALVGGTRIVSAVKRVASIPVDVHLMVSNPDQMALRFVEAGADIVLFHLEVTSHPAALVRRIHELGRRAGIALQPDTPAELIRPVAQELDCVMAMTVQPGSSGQQFIEAGCARIPALRRMCRAGIDVYVDGGINVQTAPIAVRYGANVLAAASAIFRADVSPGDALVRLRRAAESACQESGSPRD